MAAAQTAPPEAKPVGAMLLDHLCRKSLRHNEEDRLYGIFSVAARATIKYDGGTYAPDVIDNAVQNSAIAIQQNCSRIEATDDPHKLGLAIEIVRAETDKLIRSGRADPSARDLKTRSPADLSQELSSREIDTWLDRLPPQQRALAVFLYASNVSPEDVALAVGAAPSAVPAELAETKATLLRFFGTDGEAAADDGGAASPGMEGRPPPRHVAHARVKHRPAAAEPPAAHSGRGGSGSAMEFTIASGTGAGGAPGRAAANAPDPAPSAAEPAAAPPAPGPSTPRRREASVPARERRSARASEWREASAEAGDWHEAAAAAADRREIRMSARPTPPPTEPRSPAAAPAAAAAADPPVPLVSLLAPGRPERVRITGISSDVYGGWSLLATVTGLPRENSLVVTEPFLLVPDQPGRKRMIVTGASEISQPGEPTRRFLLKAYSIDGEARDAPGVNVAMTLGEAHITNASALRTLHNPLLSNIEITRCLWWNYGAAPDPGLCR
ncbi:MAG TPA: hypothetical protein VFA12_18330 [Stellaceae bacterium]|nr:hypothetical protein [Stellaceae bacterium]